MSTHTSATLIQTALLLLASSLAAEEGVLVIAASDPKGRPQPGVVMSTKGDGATAPPTDVAGKTRLRLAPQTMPGTWVTLQITRSAGGRDLVFISPWDQRVIVPPFSNESEQHVAVVVTERSNRDILSSKDALIALATKVAAQVAPRRPDTPSKADAVKAVAAEYGLSPDDLDAAIRGWNQRVASPHDKGIIALYNGDYRESSTQLTKALETTTPATSQDHVKSADAAAFLGRSLYEEGRYAEAVNAFKRALQVRDGDHDLLAALGQAAAHVQTQTGSASHGGTLIQAQASTQYNFNYFATVAQDGTAGELITKAATSTDLQALLGFINRDASAALGLWEAQLRDHYSGFLDPAGRAEETVTPSRRELRAIQEKIATALATQELSVVKAQLFMLDGLASELAAKAQRSRPVHVERTKSRRR